MLPRLAQFSPDFSTRLIKSRKSSELVTKSSLEFSTPITGKAKNSNCVEELVFNCTINRCLSAYEISVGIKFLL